MTMTNGSRDLRVRRLIEKIILVTGAASGIGRASALRFAAEGATVVALDINPDGLAETRQHILAANGVAHTYTLDLTAAEQVEATIGQIIVEHGAPHGLMNVAGGSGRRYGDGPIDQCTLDGWHHTLNLNLTSMFLVCKYAIPHMQNHSSIVNLGSVLGLTGNVEFATHAYAAAKGAVASMSRAMAIYYAARGIRVNVIAPGLIRTGMSARAASNETIMAMMQRLQPLTGTIGEAEAVADVAAFLMSDDARFVTGVVLPVDGGWTAQ